MTSLRTIGVVLLLTVSVQGANHGRDLRGPFTIFIATDGNDSNAGTIAAPLRTLEAARDLIRRRRQVVPYPKETVVYIRAGTYYLAHAFALTTADGGMTAGRITYSGYPGERVVIRGGQTVRWSRTTAAAAGVPNKIGSKIIVSKFPTTGMSAYDDHTARGWGHSENRSAAELFIAGKRMTPARWPNRGWARISRIVTASTFEYEAIQPPLSQNAHDVWAHGYWQWPWADSVEHVASVDAVRREIVLDRVPEDFVAIVGQPFFVFGTPAELDSAGEWFFNQDDGRLYVWPSQSTAAGCLSQTAEPLVVFDGASFVSIVDLTFECTRGPGIVIQKGNHNIISSNLIRNIGTAGIVVESLSAFNVMSDNVIYDTGEAGVRLGGGDRRTLNAGHNSVSNNVIYDFGRVVRTYTPAVVLSGVGNEVTHNTLRNGPHSAIIIHGNDHLIAYNDIHDVVTETTDAGAIYIGRDFSERGNVIRNNAIHDLGRGQSVHGVYLDDWTSGTIVAGNVFDGCDIFIGGGRENIIDRNIFLRVKAAVHIDARGTTWARSYFDGRDDTLRRRLEDVNYRAAPYCIRYPTLAGLYDDEPAIPKWNVITGNIFAESSWFEAPDDIVRVVTRVSNNSTRVFSGRWREAPRVLSSGVEPPWSSIPVDVIGSSRR